jgi:hypothetical protein
MTPLASGERMLNHLRRQEGRCQCGLHKQTVELVFGIIKSSMRFRQFLLQGGMNVGDERNLVVMAWNIQRMTVLEG